ncbi:MAG: V-type ATPase subunit [archaeon GB-1867-005]|nr:V-type ATPase subunit [Candidatus Culexmicrobium cathedralense]
MRASKYAYSIARVRAMKSFMLTKEDYEDLLKAKDLNEAFKKLAETIYAPYFKEAREATWIEIEKKLMKALSDIYEKVIEMAPEKAKDILSLIEKKLEIETLKQLIRGCISKLPIEEAMKFIFPIGEYSTEFCREFLRKDLNEAIELIKDEEIKEIIKQKIPEYEKLNITTPIEVALDKHILSKLLRQARKLPKLDKKHCEHLVGIEIDMTNITTIVRGKAMKLSVKEIKDMLIPESYKLDREIIAAIGVEDPFEAYRLLVSGYYIGKLPPKVNSVEEVEWAVKKAIINESRRVYITYPFHAGLLYAFMNLKYYEVRDVRVILMGKHLGVEEQIIRKHLLFAYK